jgi:arsenite methyltransferase
MSDLTKEQVRAGVRESYAAVARGQTGGGCCQPGSSPSPSESKAACCAPPTSSARAQSGKLGYSETDLDAVPEDSNMGLGCGNPTAMAELKAGETVLDLGSGGGFDCFIAARQVGPEGAVIGVDMTPDMIALARKNAAEHGYDNVEFRLGEIEHLPVADNTIDVILSNCVINLSPEKAQVFADAFRALKAGGRLRVSDVVALKPVPDEMRNAMDMVSGCIGGAALVDEIQAWLKDAGFTDISIEPKPGSRDVVAGWAPGQGAENYVASADITAVKPSV